LLASAYFENPLFWGLARLLLKPEMPGIIFPDDGPPEPVSLLVEMGDSTPVGESFWKLGTNFELVALSLVASF